MQGDVVPTAMGNPSVNAGMIPRVLFKLFEHLETLPDYAVKVSYIELYNEDLRDLLAPEATKDTPRTELKIFDDSAKKGVFIQGLEEVGVRSIGDALGALSRGSQRRQIAATKMNDHSSRSHSVFTLTVHTKEASPAGEDLLRVGKMNLVDLAGSENIGRSGAADKRAREAGMINQSLLTLGRVINGLVDGAAHVPYRESKLTRLLQDSLGGRTKTSIIATVSPARVNMEETLSTLEYALRAKSIRNKPEVNTRMTRNALLKEYVAEMERLKADVLAAREKNGIFVSELRWGELEAEQDAARRGALDAKKQIEAAESQLRNLQEEFKQSITLLGRKDTELTDARGQLEATAHTLEQTAGQLRTTETALEEEAAVRRAHEQAEELLDQIATGLRETLVQSLGDNAGLFDKLERKAGVLTANTDTVRTHGQALSRDVQALSSQLETFASSATQHAQKVKLEVEHLRRTELDALAALTEQVNEQANRTQEALGVVQAKEAIGDEAMRSIETVVTTALDHLKKGFAAWGEKMRQTSQAKCNSLQESSQSSFTSVGCSRHGVAVRS
jgi:kinesin family protein 11